MKRKVSTILVTLLFLGLALWFWPLQSQKADSVSRLADTVLVGKMSSPPPRTATTNEKLAWRHEMFKEDLDFEYKTPFRFYGKTVDEAGNPIGGASVRLSWMDKTVGPLVNDNQERIISTDEQGLFSLESARGKGLFVQPTKPGYNLSKTKNRGYFDFSEFFSKDFHEPDPAKPVLFVLRKNREAESLVVEDRRVRPTVSEPLRYAYGKSKEKSASNQIIIQLLENTNRPQNVWSARISVADGGIQSTAEEFPSEAPADGYQATIVVNQGLDKPSSWPKAYQGGQFYVKTTAGYSRLKIEMIAGAPSMTITSYFNPSGSRNLEFDPAKTIPSLE